jgi:hypothetical protein
MPQKYCAKTVFFFLSTDKNSILKAAKKFKLNLKKILLTTTAEILFYLTLLISFFAFKKIWRPRDSNPRPLAQPLKIIFAGGEFMNLLTIILSSIFAWECLAIIGILRSIFS